ncbi:Fatty acid hydroxylase superfamily protein [compost metagenome]
MFESFADWTRLQKLLFQFDEPTSRLYHVNIISSFILLALVALWWAAKSKVPFTKVLKKWVFTKRYWWNRSTKQDYGIYFVNALIKSFLLVPLLECSYAISQVVIHFLIRFNDGEVLSLPAKTSWVVAFTLGAFVWDDFLRFFDHWLMHKVPFFWNFHKTHHSARVLTPITLYRSHPVESITAIVRNSLSFGVSLGVFVFIFGSSFSLWTLLGINGFGFIFNLVGANLRHSHIPMHFGVFEYILISPIQHQVHHSKDPKHYDKNFGVSLAIWDYLSGSLVKSKEVGKLKFGLNEPFKASLIDVYKKPFVDLFRKDT